MSALIHGQVRVMEDPGNNQDQRADCRQLSVFRRAFSCLPPVARHNKENADAASPVTWSGHVRFPQGGGGDSSKYASSAWRPSVAPIMWSYHIYHHVKGPVGVVRGVPGGAGSPTMKTRTWLHKVRRARPKNRFRDLGIFISPNDLTSTRAMSTRRITGTNLPILPVSERGSYRLWQKERISAPDRGGISSEIQSLKKLRWKDSA